MRLTFRRRLHDSLSRSVTRRGRRVGAAAALATVVATVAGASLVAPAHASGWSSRSSLTVMTRNLYLGADLTPALAIDPADPAAGEKFVGAVAAIYGTALRSDFPARARAVAAEIQATDPDLIGLQEVSIWDAEGVGAPPDLDFLAVLQATLRASGLNYSVAAVSSNATIGPLPLYAPCGTPLTCTITLKDRDVILVNDDTRRLDTWGARSGLFTTQQFFQPPVPGAPPVSFSRGWATIEGRIGHERFRFATTHLEVETFAGVQEAQAAEFLAGPARSRYPTVITGDFNSAADGSTTTSYAQLAAAFRDAWSTRSGTPGLTCCQSETLANPTSQLSTRIDLAMGRRGARPLSATVVGAAPFGSTPPLYASDHAGVVATFSIDD